MSDHLTPEQVEAAARGEATPHLADCAECRGVVARARGRQRLLSGLRPYTLSDEGFRRVEARLLEVVRRGPSRRRWWPLLLPLAAAAAAALVLVLRTSPTPPPAPPVALQPAPVRAVPLRVLLASAASRQAPEGWVPLRAGDRLEGDTALRAARVVLARPHLVLDGAPSRVLAPGSAADLRQEGAELFVDAQGEETTVTAGPRWLRARDAAFHASRAAASVDLDVRRGEVWVSDSADFEGARRISAPVRVRFADGSPELLPADDAPAAAGGYQPPAEAGAVLDLSALPQGDAAALDGARLGGAPLSLLLPPGRYRLQWLAKGRVVGERFVVAGDGAAALEEPAPRPPPALPVLSDDEAQAALAAAVKAQRLKLQGCYEKWLKNDPHGGGEVVLKLGLLANGRVRQVLLEGGPLPDSVGECLKRTARGFRFPATGQDLDLEMPVQLQRPGAKSP